MKKIPIIKPRPRGSGTFYVTVYNTVEHKKMITLNDGRKVRRTVHGNSQTECEKKMEELERSLKQNSPKSPECQPLIDAMLIWIKHKKKGKLKKQAYLREVGTIKNQIGTSAIAHFRYQSITPEEIQEVLNVLEEKGYSYSVIKKTYDTFNSFYRDKSKREHFENPMLFVEGWKKENVTAKEKEIEFFEPDDIKKFVEQAGTKYRTGTLRYATGYVLAANIFLGLRIGELLALKWEDVDMEARTIYVHKTLIEIQNPLYDSSKPDIMKEKGIKKVIFEVQEATKTNNERYVPINEDAKKLLELHYQYATYTESDDFVISTRTRHTSTPKNVSDTIKAIVQGGNLKTQKWNTHILRHTCASLYFRAGIDLTTIAKILGNSEEVLRSTYIHLVNEQLQEAASKQAAKLPPFHI